MRILLTNDDGLDADGLIYFARQLASIENVEQIYVIAPDGQRSCCGHSVMNADPFSFQQVEEPSSFRHDLSQSDREKVNWYSVEGWPADCVRVGLIQLQLKPDWIFSGINHGGNLGIDVWMSGTCSAAREGCWHGFPSIAISQYRHPKVAVDWQFSAEMGWRAAKEVFTRKPSTIRGFWNVNLPALEVGSSIPELVECEVDDQLHQFHYRTNDNASIVYVSDYQNRPRKPNSDVEICFSGKPTLSFCPA